MMTVYVQKLQRKLADELDEESRGYISNVVKGGERISRLIDGLLEFSRLGEVDTSDPVPVNAQAALKEALVLLCYKGYREPHVVTQVTLF
jgi:signal transduction histidine kinase